MAYNIKSHKKQGFTLSLEYYMGCQIDPRPLPF